MSESTADPPPLLTETRLLSALTPLIPTYTHLIITALLPIVTGAHASLTRPNNVRPPSKKSKDKASSPSTEEDGDDEDDDEEQTPVETLTPRDAMLFPVTAGIMLGGLYLMIKYLDNPTILSKVMTYYFTLVGTFAVGKFCADTLGVVVSLVFPRRWSQMVGGKRWVYVAGHDRYKLLVNNGGSEEGVSQPEAGVKAEMFNPFPRSIIPIPKSLYATIWTLRRSLLAKWAVVFKLGRGKGGATRTTFWAGDIIGLIIGIICVAGYVISGKHWIGTNIMGVSFAYGAMQLISPTTFGTATLLLSLLFIYDIYFVFYTPLMVTVATNLDVPIKLLFPRPSLDGADPEQSKKRALAMLGLGDVVLPGIMMAMALRFDFWRWCEARKIQEQSLVNTGDTSVAKPTKDEQQLPKYIKPTGTWGERMWNCGLKDVGGVFPKTYFWASMCGYVAGMVATLYVMHVWNHAQPALLYLVPGVLGAVWGTAVLRGEHKMAWAYTEEVILDEEEQDEKGKEAKKGVEEKKSVKTPRTKGEDGKESVEVGEVSAPEESKAELAVDEAKEMNDEEDEEDTDIEIVDEKGEAEYISVKIVKKPAPGAAFTRR